MTAASRAWDQSRPGIDLPGLQTLPSVALVAGLAAAMALLMTNIGIIGLGGIAVVGLVVVGMYPNLAVPFVIGVLFTNIASNAVNLYGAPQMVSLALPLVLLLPVWHAWFAAGLKLVWPPALWAILVFVLVNLVSVLASADPRSSLMAVRTTLSEGFVLVLLMVNAIRTRESLYLALTALVAAAALVGAVSVFQELTGTYYTRYFGLGQLSDDAFETGEETLEGSVIQLRLGGPIGEKNYYAQFMLMVIPIGAAVTAMTRGRLRQIALLLATLLVGAGVVLTFSRGAAVAAVGVIGIAVVLRMVPMRVILATALGAALVLGAFPQYLTRIATVTSVVGLADGGSSDVVPDNALRGRAGENAAAISAFLDHPLLGLGPGEFPAHYERYARTAGVEDLHGRERVAHSLFLGLLAEVGVLGVAAFIAVLVAADLPLLRIRRRARRPADRALATGLLLGLLAYVFAGLFLDLAYARYFWLLVALAAAGGAILDPRSDDEDARRPSSLLRGDA